MKNSIEIIAEIAQGFEGNEKLTDLLIKGAISSDADAVKFQLVYADELATPDYEHYQLFKELEMAQSIWTSVCEKIHDAGKKVYFDVFGLFSLDMAKKVGADGVKLSTTEFYNNTLFDRAIVDFEMLFLSVGGIPIEDIDKKISVLSKLEIDKICLMYGFQSEPTPLDQNNLNKLSIFKNRYPDFRIGFMDHSDGALDDAFHLSLVAIGTGINVIEKHITLDRELKIEDYISGIAPTEFIKFVDLVRRFEPVMGINSLKLTEQEETYRNKATKSVVAISNLKLGDTLTLDSIALKRCSKPIGESSILEIEQAIGKTLATDISINSPVLKVNL
ncbi:N-acetylneuraminate synthase family protein [Oceanospirillaceae bacterium]|jgi:N,N'-diacetyllegionaminate synthase|nr:N-acetylneuraminate synthase family protein [Oceanospirillaceae bacterium]MDC1350559.1 N-acetylneuraminate synthase family protein [Oceanospirillaceae bacterium]